jgi:hypothetical protein
MKSDTQPRDSLQHEQHANECANTSNTALTPPRCHPEPAVFWRVRDLLFSVACFVTEERGPRLGFEREANP